nr:helix-turn-helix transcriptional regulator [uncultured Dysosmobacter sp.]
MSTAYPRNDSGERAKDAQTLIKTGRKTAGMSQEDLAAFLGTDPRTLRRWESGEAPTPDDIMLAVAKLAGSPLLMFRHFKEKYKIADEIMPSVQSIALSQAVINLLYSLADLEREQVATKLLDLAADGMIEYQEEADFAYIMAKLDGVVRAVMNLKYCELRRSDYDGENVDS